MGQLTSECRYGHSQPTTAHEAPTGADWGASRLPLFHFAEVPANLFCFFGDTPSIPFIAA